MSSEPTHDELREAINTRVSYREFRMVGAVIAGIVGVFALIVVQYVEDIRDDAERMADAIVTTLEMHITSPEHRGSRIEHDMVHEHKVEIEQMERRLQALEYIERGGGGGR